MTFVKGSVVQGFVAEREGAVSVWNRATLWTRVSNERARRLYEGQGYQESGQEATLGDGDHIRQLERQASR